MRKIKVLNKTVIFSLLCCYSIIAYPQANINIPRVAVPSPNAASIAIHGQIPVSLFNGLPQISIPLGEVQAGKINVPISLNYHGGGIRPDHHPSWVGLGWDLQAGGVITRRVVGAADEILVEEEWPNVNKFSYYDHYSRLDNNSWASTDSLYVYMDDGTHRQIYPAPDEFIFNFGGYSGSFFLDHKGKWRVRSSSPLHLKVEEELANSFMLAKQQYGDEHIQLGRIFHRFTITTPDGCKYIFGGTQQSIEFTRSAAEGNAPNGDLYNARLAATAWYLTKIISRDGHEIEFTYERNGIQTPLTSNLVIFTWDVGATSYSHEDNNNISAPIINTSYLRKITAPNQVVEFLRSDSDQLGYDDIRLNSALSPAVMYTDLSRNGAVMDLTRVLKYPRLDSIAFYSGANTLLKTIEFHYRPQTDIRLTLDSIREIGAKGGIQYPYQFGYNSLDLPPYNSRRLDHWGFYNGKNYFTDAGLPDYFTSRHSDTALMKKGLLTSIKYPTGGKSTFLYEAHVFSKIANRFPFTVTDTTGNVKCGGVRIRKIENRDMADSLLESKEYFYVRDFQSGGTVSSGIISDNPQYDDIGSFPFETMTVSYAFRSAFSIDPLNFTNGNHVTYSEVTEKLADGSYTIYKYSNHDDGSYRDEPGIQPGLYMTPNKWKLDPGASRALERGKLLLKSIYNASNILLQRTKYDYDTSSARYAEKVRTVSLAVRWFINYPDMAREVRGIGYYEYVFPRFLIKQTDTTWNQNGTNPLVTTTHYRYNDVYRLPSFDSTLTSAKADTVWRWHTYKYPFDMLSGGDPTGIYQKMVDSHFIAPQIEVRAFVNSQQMSLTKTNYYSPYPKLFAPQTVQVQDRNNPIETRLRYHNYDTKANILSVSRENDTRISYLWNYKQAFPVAEIKNADTTSNIAYSSFESDSTGGWNNYTGTIVKAIPAIMPPSGKNYYTLSPTNTLVKSGLSSVKTYILSYWTRNANAFSVTGTVSGFPAKGRSVNDWNYFEHKITGQTTITLSGTGLVDEVRLYPFGAQMTTFSFDPGIGIVSLRFLGQC
ncbi:MAG TPA: hypothetical protein PK339_05765 [Flavitalea sp.]|nr:hypothetical protein [Flavitalea sp.]